MIAPHLQMGKSVLVEGKLFNYLQLNIDLFDLVHISDPLGCKLCLLHKWIGRMWLDMNITK